MTFPSGFTPPRILWITDPHFGEDVIVHVIAEVASALPRGMLGVQLRDKACAPVALRAAACRLRAATRAMGVSLFVNGSPHLTRDVGADGVHLPADGAHRGGEGRGVEEARRIIGRPTWCSMAAHSDQDVLRARAQGADAVLVSPVFSTHPPGRSGPGLEKCGRGTQALRRARALADDANADLGGPWRGASSSRRTMLVFGLGGITPDTAGRCIAAGADGVALVRAIVAGGEPNRIARALHDVFARH